MPAGQRAPALIAVLALSAAACAPSTADLARAQRQLLQRDQAWSDLAAAGQDVEKTAAFWADDAVIIPPGQPLIRGKEAIRAFVAGAFQTPGFSIRWKSETPSISPDGKLAYLRGTNSITAAGPDGTPVTRTARALTVWRLESDGQWRCVVDIWNDSPPPGSAAP